ncbi:phenylalanine--tRNA ligase subunit alpha [Candidatus Bathyarchaeota archaeon]|nr:MAG: phenylalanine--tRNA ligase subunit alpha [Candidatus Bathyarchaeota archaeon]
MTLRENELKTLKVLGESGGKASIGQIVSMADLAHAAVMRAALSLSEKNLAKIGEEKKTYLKLTAEGEHYTKLGMPERRLLKALLALGGEASLKEVAEKSSIDEKLLPIALGWLHKKNWAKLDRKAGRLKALVKKAPPLGHDEKLLSLLSEEKTVNVENLPVELRNVVSTLKKRKLIEVEEKTTRWLELTENGWKLVRRGIKVVKEVSQLTPELIVSGKWRKVKLRKFNVVAPGPPIYPGKLHPLRQLLEWVREVFLEMGFTEIRGPIVETAFWNFDALFQPQDHPAREMHDTFYLAYPQTGRLPDDEVVERVAKTHEDGWLTGSRGWRYKWSHEIARKLVLRTHTTATTIRYLAKHKKPPVRVFSVDRVYRNEKLDYKHLAELNQVEGIIMDKGVTFRDLIGTIKEFYRKLGIEKVVFWPSYFPYTEPSAQAVVYIPKLKVWMEMGGMGMFRPEVLAPLGIKYPVLAWGLGFDRLAMVMLDLDDIRLLYKNDLGWLRRTPLCR